MAGLLTATLHALETEGLIQVDDVDALGTVVYGAVTAGALDIARAHDKPAAAAKVRTALIRILDGLRPAKPQVRRR